MYTDDILIFLPLSLIPLLLVSLNVGEISVASAKGHLLRHIDSTWHKQAGVWTVQLCYNKPAMQHRLLVQSSDGVSFCPALSSTRLTDG